MKNIFFKRTANFFYAIVLLCMMQTAGKAQVGNALDFDGVDDYVDLGSSGYLNVNNALTVELWVYMATWTNGQTIIENTSNSAVLSYGGYEISTLSGNLNGYLHRNGSYCVVSTPLAGITSGWHHLALTFDGRYTKLYVDAILKSTDDAFGIYSIGYSNYNVLLGKCGGLSAGGGTSGYFYGRMDELRIWDIARSACDISNYMNIGGIPIEAGTNNYDCFEDYTFNNGTANGFNTGLNTLFNGSPYGYSVPGTLMNFALSGTTSNWVAGIVTTGSNSLLAHTQNTVPCVGGTTTVTASGATSYTWSTGHIGATLAIPVVATYPGYTVYATRANGCIVSDPDIFISYHAPYMTITASDAVICSGTTVTLTASGASTYTWSTGSHSSSITATPGSTITRTVTGTDAFGCKNGPDSSAVITVSVNTTPVVTIVPSSTVICSANNVTLTAGGASTYTWSNGLGNNAVVSLGPNANFTRTVTGTAVNGCTDQAVQTISVNASPVLTITPGNTVTCSGNPVTLTASGANTYTWTGGPTTAAYSPGPLTTTIYTVTGTTSASGCTDTAVQSISVIASPTAIISASPATVICLGVQASLTASGGSTYLWSNGGATTNSIAITPANTVNRTVTVTAANGCTDTAVQTISVNPTPTISITGGTVICSGKTTTLTGSGASTYTWNTGATATVYALTPSVTTIYTLTGTTAASGCTDNVVQTVSVNASPTVNISSTGTVICSGKTTTLTASGANTYVWTSGPSTAANAVSPAATTIYTVTGTTTASGCTDTAVQSISVNVSPTVNISSTGTIICSGKTATLTANGANTYVWISGPFTAANAVSPIATTIYTVTGTTTASGCTDTAVQSVSVNASPTVNISSTGTVICSGKTTTLTANGANTYVWTSGPSTAANAVTPLTITNYTVTGTTTTSGCTDTAVQSVSVNASPTINISSTGTIICSGKTTTLTGSGANTYTWNTGSTATVYAVTPSVTTSYTLTGTTAASGCTDNSVQTVSVNASPTVNISSSSTVVCSGNSATLTGGGASTYSWSNGPTTTVNVVTPSVTTTYTLTGTTAASGCTDTAVLTVSVNATPTVNITSTGTIICSGKTTTLTANGANSYQWILGPSTAANAVNPLTTTIYTVTGTNPGNCTSTAVQNVSVNAIPALTITSPGTVICSGNTTTVTASGATSYVWASGGPGTNSYVVTPLVNTTYTVTGTTNACTNTAVQIVSVNITPTVNITSTGTIICSGKTTTLTANGANSYQWILGPSTAANAVNPLTTTIYTVTGTNPGNCTSTAVQNVSVNATPALTITSPGTVICSGNTTTVTASGATSYVWANSGPGTNSYIVTPLVNTTYTVTGTTNACTNTAVQIVSVNITPTVNITSTGTIICSGKTTTLTANGANSYQWVSGPSTTVNAVSPLTTTIYTVTGTNPGNCTSTAVQNVSVNATPVLTITSPGTVICSGNTTTVTASGATSYVWSSGGPVTNSYVVTPSVNTTYTVTGTTNTCTNTAVQIVSVNASPALTITATSTLICSTGNTTLTASGANTYSWSNGPTTTVNVVSPVANITYTLTGTNSVSSCTSIAVQNISVVATVVLTVTPSSSVICSGKTATLTALGASSYSWTNGPSTGVYVVTPTANTIYTVTGTAGSCSNTTTQSIVVNALPVLTITPSSTVICSGNTTTLTGSGANTYTWTGGPSTAAYAVNPSVTTIYTVTGTAANNCTNTAVKSISVNALPVLTITPSSTVLCAGNTATLTGSGANTFTWTGGPSTAGYTVGPLITSSYTLSGTNSVSNCSNTAVQSISVNAVPVLTVTSSTSVICSGNSVNLNANGASTYTWTNGPSTGTYTVSPLATTIYTVTGTTAASGCTAIAVTSLTVNANPTITVNSGTICTGSSFTLNANGANTYSWNTGATTSSINVTPATTTVYVVTGTNTNNCINTATSNIVVANLLVVTIVPSSTAICAGTTVTLTANGANTFSWSNASSSSSIVVSPSLATTYSVTGSSGATCSNTSSQLISINPSPTISVSGNTFVCTGAPTILNASGAISYTWNTGANSSAITVTPAISTTYTVLGSNSFSCTNSSTFQVQTPALITPSICLITVDSLSINNEIYWDKTQYPRADTFIVLRETSASIYTPIARIPKTAFSGYVDTNSSVGPITGNPNISSHKYKLQFRDSCGNLSPLSPYHQSIFIQDNQTGNFTWNPYFIEGVGPIQTVNYILWRQNVISGLSTTVGVTSSNAATDPQYANLAQAGNVKWFVSTNGFNCNPSLRISDVSAAPKVRTKGNNTNEKQYPVGTGIQKKTISETSISIYPNPAENQLMIKINSSSLKFYAEIRDVSGRLILRETIHENKLINTENIINGIYFISLYDENDLITVQKIVVQH